MNSGKPVTLSVCIATLNRAAFIGETLESIVSQATDEVEIVIVDGGSSDNTTEVVARFLDRGVPVRYHRLERKGGVDRDYDLAVSLAEGRYCWLFPDDDLLEPGAIARVLEAVGSGFTLVIVNSSVWTKEYSRIIEKSRLPFPEDRTYPAEDLVRLFVDTAAYLSYIGGVVIRKDAWLERERERYYGTEFIHFGVIFQARLPGPALAIGEPLIRIRFANSLWSSRTFRIWLVNWAELVWSLPDIPEEAKRLVSRKDPWKHPLILIDYRARGAYSLSEYRRWTAPRASVAARGPAFLVAVMPCGLANLLSMAYLRLVGNRSPLLLEDMRSSRYNIRNWLRSRPRTE